MKNGHADDAALSNPELYVNRELSWLAFNERVLDQAADASWPLLERLKFLAIFGSNLDEFFMIRVSGLHEQLESGVDPGTPERLGVAEQLARIRQVVAGQTRRADGLWLEELRPLLRREGIHVQAYADLSDEQRAAAQSYFASRVFPVLTPLAVDPAHPFPFLSNLSLSLAVEVEDPETLERRFARVKVPSTLPRFVELGGANGNGAGTHVFVALEEIIAGNLSRLFPGMRIGGAYALRVTRDMDFELLEDEAEDLLSVVDREIMKRRFGEAVRLELAPGVPARVRDQLLQKLGIDGHDVYEAHGLLGLSGLFGIAQLSLPALRDAPVVARLPPEWESQPNHFACIAERDVLVHHPYESFTPVLEFLRQAADDPDVLAIKMTLYRAGSDSDAVRVLARAAENGKQVAVSVELKARFDEANNIGWARTLERAGAHVFYGIAGLKTHAKLLLVVRREGAELKRYLHLSTGNYNASTAKLYTDLGFFTADPEFGADASEFFNALSGFSRGSSYQRLIVAPHELRRAFLRLIDEQAERARGGLPAKIFAKLNALVDPQIIRHLYRASQAGVPIDLVVRGVCCLRPQVEGVSEHIRVRSVLGRFLEHERIYVFGVDPDQRVFLSSADWMPRNLDRRVEVLYPIDSPKLRERIRAECLVPLESPGARVYEMAADGSYARGAADPEHARDVQLESWSAIGRRASEHPAPMH